MIQKFSDYVNTLLADITRQEEAAKSKSGKENAAAVKKGSFDTKRGAKLVAISPEMYELAASEAPAELVKIAKSFTENKNKAIQEEDKAFQKFEKKIKEGEEKLRPRKF